MAFNDRYCKTRTLFIQIQKITNIFNKFLTDIKTFIRFEYNKMLGCLLKLIFSKIQKTCLFVFTHFMQNQGDADSTSEHKKNRAFTSYLEILKLKILRFHAKNIMQKGKLVSSSGYLSATQEELLSLLLEIMGNQSMTCHLDLALL